VPPFTFTEKRKMREIGPGGGTKFGVKKTIRSRRNDRGKRGQKGTLVRYAVSIRKKHGFPRGNAETKRCEDDFKQHVPQKKESDRQVSTLTRGKTTRTTMHAKGRNFYIRKSKRGKKVKGVSGLTRSELAFVNSSDTQKQKRLSSRCRARVSECRKAGQTDVRRK